MGISMYSEGGVYKTIHSYLGPGGQSLLFIGVMGYFHHIIILVGFYVTSKALENLLI